MRYIPILPIGMLETGWKVGSKDAFILPQYWDIPAYKSFYTTYDFDTVIIDNDVYETGECTPLTILDQIADEITAKKIFIVGHESPGDPHETIIGFIDEIRTYEIRHDPMIVLDGTPSEIKSMYNILKYEESVGYSLPVSLYRRGYDRASIYNYVGFHQSDYVHALGVDNIMEIASMNSAGYNSVDSSIAATAAVNEYNLRKEFLISRTTSDPIPRVDLKRTSFTTSEIMDTIANIQLVNEFAYGEV